MEVLDTSLILDQDNLVRIIIIHSKREIYRGQAVTIFTHQNVKTVEPQRISK